MGRPRKRQKTDDEPAFAGRQTAVSPRPIQPATPRVSHDRSIRPDTIDPTLTVAHEERAQFENICNGPVAQSIRTQGKTSNQTAPALGLPSSYSDTSPSQNEIPTPDAFDPFDTSYPTDVAQWPDFSTMDMLPLPVEDKFSGIEPGGVGQDPDVNPDALSNLPSIPACPCLPNLYLTLSTLSTLSNFPFDQSTIRTIQSGYKTARGVIYCPVCPQKFDTGSSNLMLGTTLLNVLSDQWNRFRKLSVDELRKSFGSLGYQQSFVTFKGGQEWRHWQHSMLRAYVFGDQPIPVPPGATAPPSPSSPPLTLMGLADSLERRQRQWHKLEAASDEFPDRVTPDLQSGHMVGHSVDHPGKHLCLEIVNHAKCIVQSLASSLDGPMHAHH